MSMSRAAAAAAICGVCALLLQGCVLPEQLGSNTAARLQVERRLSSALADVGLEALQDDLSAQLRELSTEKLQSAAEGALSEKADALSTCAQILRPSLTSRAASELEGLALLKSPAEGLAATRSVLTLAKSMKPIDGVNLVFQVAVGVVMLSPLLALLSVVTVLGVLLLCLHGTWQQKKTALPTPVEPPRQASTAAEKPQIIYNKPMGPDPFHIDELVKWTGASPQYVSYAVSLGLTFTIAFCNVLVGWPLRLATEAVWGARGQEAPASGFVDGAPLLQGIWDFVAKDNVEWTGSPIFPGVFFLSYYFLTCMPTLILDVCDFDWSKKFKIQPNVMPSFKDLSSSLATQLLNIHFLCQSRRGFKDW
eukprot:TRINITY_DN11285_c0_g1_i3.p1 TRINITY_DN11285_c0_g1~~TRINITY_DN11285_c0_g1_i3.p1  ORF type:complete len:365 (-),score=81.98 TRINITY_DN11285_c0_g1_i3:153-1247(-)